YEQEPEPVAAPRERRPDRAFRAIVAGLIGLLVIAAVVIVASGSSGGGPSGGSQPVKLSPVNGGSVGEIVDQANQLIDDNTR
ncbi:MAG: hypothetical protein M3296_06255, partial [Actinomycetota bacterium]|nr:hypothetical protein [Actinomycetota bacterium]